MDSKPTAVWTAEALIDATDLPVVDVVVILAHLTFMGRIERCSLARYRSRSQAIAQRVVS